MSGEPPEVPPAPAAGLAGADGESPRTVRMVPRPASAGMPDLAAIEAAIAAEEVAPTERRPAVAAPDLSDGPPEINRFLSPPPPADAPPSSAPEGGSVRRRSRRTVKIPDDAIPRESGPPSAPAPVIAAPPPAPVEPPAPVAAGSPHLFIPPTPPVPTLLARTQPSIPRPVAKSPGSQPAPVLTAEEAARAPSFSTDAAPAPAPDEEFEVIRPMRIINIGSAQQAPAPTPPEDEASDKRVSRPPMHALHDGAELESFTAPPAAAVPKIAKPPVVEEVEAIEEVEEPPADEAPRGAKTDEIEPIAIEEEVDDRISDFDLATAADLALNAPNAAPTTVTPAAVTPAPSIAVSSVAVDVDLDAPKPKKPPPPPPKRTNSGEIPAVTGPLSARIGDLTPPAPVVAPPAATPVTPPPPAVAPAAPAAPAAAAPASPPAGTATLDLSNRKRQKPWWEEIFSDDYIRTLERVEPKHIRKECDFIEDRLGLEKGAVMLDLACGEGAHAVELAGRGYNVVGYDLSLAMLARAQDEAQERGQKINFLQGDMREMAFEEAFDGIYSWSTSFGYFDDEKNVNVLSRIHRGLRQGGMFLLDVINRDYVCPRQPSLVWFEGDGCVCMDEMFVDFFTSRLRVKRTVMFEDGRARECDYGIRLYGLHELGKMLHDTGFKVVEVTGHPAHPGVFFGSESPRIIVLAERA